MLSKSIVFTTLLFFSSSFFGSRVEAQTAYVIIACPTKQAGGGTDAETNRAGKLSKNMILQLLKPLGSKVKAIDLTGDSYSGPKVLEAIAQCPAGRKDTIFVYVMGHGSYDPKNRWSIVVDNDLRSGRRLVRGDITRTLRSRNVRLGILLTESCAGISNDPSTVEQVRRIMTPRVRAAYGDEPESQSQVLHRLFFKNSGTVDLAASEVTQYANFNSEGPFFLRSVCAALNSNSGNASWSDVFSNSLRMVNAVSKGKQKPVAISLPSNTGTNRASLGVSAKGYDRKIYVTKVLPNSPASRIGLQANDVIKQINANPIRTTGELLDTIKRSPAVAELTINRGGTEMLFRVRLSR